MKKLGVGITSFRELIEQNYVYVDKTSFIDRVTSEGKYYFLSRPRRFGKSLLVDTIKELFEGSQDLFQRCHIYDHWDWNTRYPVIHINFAKGGIRSTEDLATHITHMLDQNARTLGVERSESPSLGIVFAELIRMAKEKHGQNVVVLVDEYDKPLLDNVTNHTVAQEIRDQLRDFYSVLKEQEKNLRFAFLTGISQFSKVSLFSGLNNLEDISLDPNFGAICGYTQQELETHFTDRLAPVNREEFKSWYNGYSWLGDSVYNPYGTLLFFKKNLLYRSYWFETSTPQFLIQLLQKKYYHTPDFSDLSVGYDQLVRFDIENLDLTTLLFQAGYLTIKQVDISFNQETFHLGFPNQEVRSNFSKLIFKDYLTKQVSPNSASLLTALQQGDIAALEQQIRSLFASIAHDNYRNNTIAHYEGYYAAVLHAYFMLLPIQAITEDATNKGKIDVALQLTNEDGQHLVYIIEFKVVKKTTEHPSNTALQQIEEKGYAEKYHANADIVTLIGIEFCAEQRNVCHFAHRTYTSK